MTVSIDNDGRGRVTIGGARYLLIRPETLAAVQKAIEAALGPRAGECLAAGGRAGGARATVTLTGTTEERARQLAATGAAIGWGQFTLERLTSDGLVVTVRRSHTGRRRLRCVISHAACWRPSPASRWAGARR